MEIAKLRPFGIFFLAFGLSLAAGVALISIVAGAGTMIWVILEGL